MEIKIPETQVGVLIGRFQTHQLHQGHKDLINFVSSKHQKVLILLGCTSVISNKNPLDFATRKVMIERAFPNVIVLPLMDKKLDDVWSKSVDEKIEECFPGNSVTLYGSRDSFIPYYCGKFQTVELNNSCNISATEFRKAISDNVRSSEDFRAGIIYSVNQQYPTAYGTVDVAIVKPESKEVLLGRKKDEKLFRFVGGFIDPTDETIEAAALREVKEETKLEVDLEGIKYICSKRVSDWRYRNLTEKSVITHFFAVEFIFGTPIASDDICELQWFRIDDSELPSKITEGHRDLLNSYKDYYGY